jgi:hypothetical protein
MIQHALKKIDALESRVSLLEAENKDLHKRLDSASGAVLAVLEHLVRTIETMPERTLDT